MSSDSSDSSPSDLRRRLEDLPSPNEFSILADRVAALGRRIGRKHELFLRLHGVANRIEENDEWQDEELRAEPWKSSLGASRSKDARARRRARIRSESSSQGDDREMVISRSGGPIDPAKITDDDKSNPAESSVDRSARDDDYLKLPAIEIPRRQSRASSLSEPSSTRCSHRNNGNSRDIKSAISALHSCRSFAPRDNALKSTDLPSVSPFSLNSVRPKRFGGYRPSSGVVLKQLSSGSESESVNGMNYGLSSARKIDNSIETLELSSPESKVQANINESVKKMPIMPARNDIIGSILPHLLPSSRSLGDDNLDRRISQDTSRSCVEQINRDGYMTRAYNEVEKINRNVARAAFNEQARCNELTTKTCNELRIEPKYEDTHDERKEVPQNTLTFSTRSFTSESAEVVTSICNEQIHDDPITKTYNEFKQIKSDFEDKRNQKEETEIHHRDDIKDQFIFNCPMDQLNLEVNSSENIDRNILATSEWNRLTSLYTQEAVETPHLTERIQSDTLEETLSSRAGPFESEGHNRSSCRPKIYLQQEALSSRRSQNNDIDTSDNYQEIITKVPALALNSQDISYSTSAGSREYSATQSLDPHALIRALSDVSLKRKQENVSRKREDFYRHGKDTIDASSRASNKNFPAKGETWRVSRSSESPRKSLSRIPSRIPIRIKSSTITSVNEVSGYRKLLESSNKNEEVASFIVNRSKLNETVIRQQSINGDMEALHKSGTMFTSPSKGTIKYDNLERSTSSNLRNSLSTPFGDYIYDRTRCFPATGSGRKNCQLFNKMVYSGDRDYAKIDDDARSRSDHSISRKSADTVDITSVTQSPYVFKNKKNESSRIESLRNVEENVTWRTEDDCASINDEENSEDVKDRDYYSAYDEKPEKLYLQTKEHFKLATERMCNPSSPFTIQHLKLDPSLEIEKGARKQQAGNDLEFNSNQLNFDPNFAKSENITFRIQRKRELSEISSSIFNLNYEAKRKKKSQERFPFTISEASTIKHQDTRDYLSSDKNIDCREKMNDQREKTVHQLQTHPSIMRLATSGLEDTVADILCCVAQEQKEVESSSKSRMKTLMRRIFSSKLRQAPKQLNDNKTLEPTKIIYENRACQVDSKANSCSGDSSTEEARRMNFDKFSNNRWIDYRVAKCSSGNILKRKESLQTIAQKHPYRRYDRDDLWIQDIKEPLSDVKKDNTSQANNSKENSPKGPCSIILARDFRSDKLSESDIDHSSLPKHHYDVLISDYMIPACPSKQSTERNISNVIPEDIEEDLTSCICWKLCRIIAPSRYRSSIRDQVSSSRTKRSSFLLWKRKK